MFNQSISKFSSSKLSIAISAAILGLIFSSFAEAEHLVINDKEYDILDKELTTPRGYGLYINAESNIVGNSLSIGMEPGYNGDVLGIYNKADSSLSIKSVDINLNSANTLTGIRTNKKLDIISSSLGIELSSDGGANRVRALRIDSGASLNLSDTDLDVVISRDKSQTITDTTVGISNAGNFIYDGKNNSLRIVTNISEGSKIESSVSSINNADSSNMRIEAKEIYLGLNLGKNVLGNSTNPQSAVAAVRSSGSQISLDGEKLVINLKDEGRDTLDRQLYGILVQDGVASFSTKTLEITGQASGGYIFGMLSQGDNAHSPSVTVDSDTKITMNADREENSYGLAAFAGGKLAVNGNLEVNASKAIAVRGTKGNPKSSEITINKNGDKTVKLYGDIDFNLTDTTSQNVEGAKVTVNLVGPESIWEGHTTITADTASILTPNDVVSDHRAEGLELVVTLNDKAKWVPDASNDTTGVEGARLYTEVLPLKTLVLDNGVIELTDKSGSEVKVTTLKGTGGEVHAQVAIDENSNITSNKLTIKKTEGRPSLAVHAEGITADDVKDRQAAMESFYANALFLDKEATANTQLHIPEGEVAGKLRATVDSEDNVTVQEDPHTISSSVLSIASSNYLSFRSQINDVASRLGDLRSMPKTAGGWVRYYGGQNKYSDRGMKEDYNTIQIGGDGFIADKYYLGGTFSYTDGNGTLVNGSSDDKNYNFGIYSGWLGEKGQFVDVIVKRHRIKSDFDLFNALGKSSGSYRTWGTSASIEAGWRLQCPINGFYAEPQAEFMLGHVESVNYKTNRGVRIHQDGINSAIGRVGVAFGYTFPENKGNAYAKASVLHDWKGDVKASYSKDGVSRRMHDDLGGTWGEFAVGATYNPIKNLSAYGQFKTTTGSPIRTPWQASIGVRYSF